MEISVRHRLTWPTALSNPRSNTLAEYVKAHSQDSVALPVNRALNPTEPKFSNNLSQHLGKALSDTLSSGRIRTLLDHAL